MDSPVTVASPAQGLTSREAAERLAQEGPNVLPERKVRGPLRIFISQFRSPFIYMLLAAAVVSWVLGQEINSYFILAVLILDALIGTARSIALHAPPPPCARWSRTGQRSSAMANRCRSIPMMSCRETMYSWSALWL